MTRVEILEILEESLLAIDVHTTNREIEDFEYYTSFELTLEPKNKERLTIRELANIHNYIRYFLYNYYSSEEDCPFILDRTQENNIIIKGELH